MFQVHSRDFGILECLSESVIWFPEGLPGFESEHRFVLIEPEALTPAVVLQSVETQDLSFLAVPVSIVDSHYQVGITVEDLRTLGLNETRQPAAGIDVLCLGIMSAAEGGMTANLLAPVVVNLKTRVGVQAVRNDGVYSHRHALGPVATGGAGGSLCS